MKQFGWMIIAAAAFVSFANADVCPEANYDACSGDGYAIVETEPVTYWPHNQMDAAHWLGIKRPVHHVRRHHVRRHHRKHRRHAVRRHHRAHSCRCRCQ